MIEDQINKSKVACNQRSQMRAALEKIDQKRVNRERILVEIERRLEARQTLLSEQQNFELAGLKLPIPKFVGALAWHIVLIAAFIPAIRIRRAIFHALKHDRPAPKAGDTPLVLPNWIAPIWLRSVSGGTAGEQTNRLPPTGVLLANLGVVVLAAAALWVGYIGLMLAWSTNGNAFEVALPVLGRAKILPDVVAGCVLISTVAAFATLVYFFLVPYLPRRKGADSTMPQASRRMFVGGVIAGAAFLGAVGLPRVAATRALQERRMRSEVAHAAQKAARFRPRQKPRFQTAHSLPRPGLYITARKTQAIDAAHELASVVGAAAPKSSLRVVGAEGLMHGTRPPHDRSKRKLLVPLPLQMLEGEGPPRRGAGTSVQLEALVLREARDTNPRVAIAWLMHVAVGPSIWRRVMGHRSPEDTTGPEGFELSLNQLVGNIRLLDLSAKIAWHNGLGEELRALAQLANEHANAIDREEERRREYRFAACAAPSTDTVTLARLAAIAEVDRDNAAMNRAMNAVPRRSRKVEEHELHAKKQRKHADELATVLRVRARKWRTSSKRVTHSDRGRGQFTWIANATDQPAAKSERPRRRDRNSDGRSLVMDLATKRKPSALDRAGCRLRS